MSLNFHFCLFTFTTFCGILSDTYLNDMMIHSNIYPRYTGMYYQNRVRNLCIDRWMNIFHWLSFLKSIIYSYFIPVQGTVKSIDPMCWRWLGNSQNYCPSVLEMTWELLPSADPRDNSFDCSLNRHEITVLLSYIHAHNHKSTEDDNVSIPYH